jgi:hypothetical protein
MHGRDEKCIQNFDPKIQREETTWETMYRSDNNIKLDLMDMECDGVGWIHLAYIGSSGRLL